MTGADILADTNAVIAWIKKDRNLARVFLAWSSPAITLFSLGELYFGALKSARPEQNRQTIETARASFSLLTPTEKTSDVYARVRLDLRAKGRPIPENDIWIAAMAIEHSLPVLTSDVHFREVDGLEVVSW